MQVAFVAMILALNGYIISNINDIHLNKVRGSSSYKEMYQKIEIVESLSSTVKLAYDLGQQLTGCPIGSQEIPSIAAVAPVKLCWVNLNSNNCLNSSTSQGQNICISSTQSVVIDTFRPTFYNFVFSRIFTKSYASTHGGDPSDDQGNSAGIQPQRVYPMAASYSPPSVDVIGPVLQGQSEAGSNVILPVDSSPTAVSSNFINCSRNHTECFSVTFCLDGGTMCSGHSRMTQTFAVRHY